MSESNITIADLTSQVDDLNRWRVWAVAQLREISEQALRVADELENGPDAFLVPASQVTPEQKAAAAQEAAK
jgi:hypothetical protein